MTTALMHGAQQTDIYTSVGYPCPVCQRDSFWFRNTEGRSACINCVIARERKR